MKIYRLYEIDGYQGDDYYGIPNERELGYYLSKEKAESHPKYQEYIILEKEREEEIKNMTDEEYNDYVMYEDRIPYGVDIEEIDVIE